MKEEEYIVHKILKTIDFGYWNINPSAKKMKEINEICKNIGEEYVKLKKIIKGERKKYEKNRTSNKQS